MRLEFLMNSLRLWLSNSSFVTFKRFAFVLLTGVVTIKKIVAFL